MDFYFMDRNIYPRDPKISIYEPWKTPTLFGPVYAIWKDFYEKLGYLDLDYDIWGGDDVDLSLKVWVNSYNFLKQRITLCGFVFLPSVS